MLLSFAFELSILTNDNKSSIYLLFGCWLFGVFTQPKQTEHDYLLSTDQNSVSWRLKAVVGIASWCLRGRETYLFICLLRTKAPSALCNNNAALVLSDNEGLTKLPSYFSDCFQLNMAPLTTCRLLVATVDVTELNIARARTETINAAYGSVPNAAVPNAPEPSSQVFWGLKYKRTTDMSQETGGVWLVSLFVPNALVPHVSMLFYTPRPLAGLGWRKSHENNKTFPALILQSD